MAILIIFGAIMLIAGIILCDLNTKNGMALLIGVTGSWLMAITIAAMRERSKPSAMDVYQGKTTLEYTIKDGVITDSVVVFKYKEK